MNEWSMYLHVMGDALGSAIVILNAICQVMGRLQVHGGSDHESGEVSSLHFSAAHCYQLMVAIILVQTIPLVKDTALILMETVSGSRVVGTCSQTFFSSGPVADQRGDSRRGLTARTDRLSSLPWIITVAGVSLACGGRP
eukprot:288830-Hanusia_phi.AAC.2